MTDDLTTQLRDAAGTATPLALDPADLRRRADRRHRNRLAAGGAVTTLAAVSVVALLLPGSGGKTSLEVPTTPGPSVVATEEPTASPSPASPVTSTMVLNGDSLGVTELGASKADAIAAVTAVLGEPTELNPSTTTCIEAQTEVFWAHFGLGFDKDGKLSGWFSGSIDAATPSGVRYGTTVAKLKDVYGSRLHIVNNVDNGWQFGVDGVTHEGHLTGGADTDTVDGFASGSCHGP
jgi:hypothetical protein